MRYATAEDRNHSQASFTTAPGTPRIEEHSISYHQPSASQDTARPDTSGTVRFGEDRVARFSAHSDDTVRDLPSSREYAGTAPTPGLDDSPYVRFAIDQLTRDEQVRGPQRADSVSSNDDYPVDRLIWDEGLGYFTRTRTPINHNNTPRRQTQKPSSPQALPERPASVDPEAFIPLNSPEESLLYPALDYLPIILRPWGLGGVILCCLLMIAAIAFSNDWSKRHKGLWDYHLQGDSRFFVMEFLPQLLAAPIVLLTLVVQASVYRVAPFAIMAVERKTSNVIQGLPIIPKNFLLPDFSHFHCGEGLIGFSLFAFWLSNWFAIPLLSCLFQAKYYTIDGQGVWRWASVQSVGWTLVAFYGLLVIGLVLLLVRFSLRPSGLMWDPVSLADLIALIQRSNILHDFEHSETVPNVRETLDPRILRLGYWKLSMRSEIFYGIGEVDAPIRTPSLHQSEKSRGKQPSGLARVSFDIEQARVAVNDQFNHHLFSTSTRYRWTPWFLHRTPIISWTVVVFALFVAFVVVSFVHHPVEQGFAPRLPTIPSTDAFSSSNFFYSFIPALIGNFLFIAWQPVDVHFRALQAFVELSSPQGATAEKSILLAYQSAYPIQVTLQAIINRHFKVAWISFMSLASLAIPILAGGVFFALFYPTNNTIRITGWMPAFYALVVLCAFYALSFLAIWPGRLRHLPHDISTLADLMSFFYQSPLLADKLLREPRSKTDLVTRLIVAPPSERALPLYGFGIYVGRDGKEHLGIDRFARPGRADMLITTGTMK